MTSIPNLGRIFRVRIRLHYTWHIAFILIIVVVVTQFPEVYPLWQRIVLGIAADLLFFIAVSLREFVLSILATSKGVSVGRVTLFVFGGVWLIPREANPPILERLLAVAGLLSNLVIAGIFYLVYLVLVVVGDVMLAGLIQWLTFIYFMLFLFHFIPGFPLEGGKLLRALLWRVTGDYDRATRIASWTGRGVGLLCIVLGVLALIPGHQWFVGIVLMFVGWVLQSAAAQCLSHAALYGALRSLTAREIMTKGCPLVSQQLSLSQLVRERLLVTAQRYFLVADGAELQGIVTMRDIKQVPKERWESTFVGEIMAPASGLKIAYPQQSAASLLEQMDELEINQMPVLEKDEVIGLVSRDSLIHLAKTRAELGI